jgi:hypothetical protein
MKRFSDTKRFDEAWYGDLSLEHKIAYEYIWARADNAGVWSPNFKLGDFQLGKKIDWKGLPEKTGKRIQALPSGLWVLVGFVEIQCGNLSAASRPHLVVIGMLRSYGLLKNDSLSIVYPEGTDTLQDKDKYTDKEEDSTRKGSAEGKPNGYAVPPCFENVEGFTVTLAQWVEHRKKIGKPPTGTAIQILINELAEQPTRAVEGMREAIKSGWQGFKWSWVDRNLKSNGGNGHSHQFTPPAEYKDEPL